MIRLNVWKIFWDLIANNLYVVSVMLLEFFVVVKTFKGAVSHSQKSQHRKIPHNIEQCAMNFKNKKKINPTLWQTQAKIRKEVDINIIGC